jgi:hypothetical protein
VAPLPAGELTRRYTLAKRCRLPAADPRTFLGRRRGGIRQKLLDGRHDRRGL